MSRRNKLQKFAELLTFPNVYENFDPRDPQLHGAEGERAELKGAWAGKHFDNDRPVVLELACGRGEYSIGLAKQYPDRNFIGVDIKGARIWKGAKTAMEEGLGNVAFLRTRIEQLSLFFAPGEVSEIWITFPDPFLRESKANRRLTSPGFLREYRKVLKEKGPVHLKTDSSELYEYTLEVVKEAPFAKLNYRNADIYAGPLSGEELNVKTYYERMHLEAGKKIKYVQFTIN